MTDEAVQANKGKEYATSGGMAFLFTLITCGIYGIYWYYKMGKFSVPTYMVGCDMGNGLRSCFGGISISPMRKSRNGIGRIIK